MNAPAIPACFLINPLPNVCLSVSTSQTGLAAREVLLASILMSNSVARRAFAETLPSWGTAGVVWIAKGNTFENVQTLQHPAPAQILAASYHMLSEQNTRQGTQ